MIPGDKLIGTLSSASMYCCDHTNCSFTVVFLELIFITDNYGQRLDIINKQLECSQIWRLIHKLSG